MVAMSSGDRRMNERDMGMEVELEERLQTQSRGCFCLAPGPRLDRLD